MTAASSHVNLRRTEPGRRLRVTALVALAGALAFAAQAALAQATTRLTKVELQPQPGNQIEVKLVLDGPAPQPVAFTIDNPARLAIDLPGTTVGLESRRIDVNSSGIDSIVAAEASGKTRVVFNLDSLQPYSTRTEGNNVYVSVGGASGNANAGATVVTTGAPAAAPGTFTIDKVDFRRGTDGAGRIMVRIATTWSISPRPSAPSTSPTRRAARASSSLPPATTSSSATRATATTCWNCASA
jgi:type IV pilus assembly protein PilQ